MLNKIVWENKSRQLFSKMKTKTLCTYTAEDNTSLSLFLEHKKLNLMEQREGFLPPVFSPSENLVLLIFFRFKTKSMTYIYPT